MEKARPGQWSIVAADPAKAKISGSFTSEDGAPVAGVEFVLIAPGGEYLPLERESAPGRGDGALTRADAGGKFNFPEAKGVGIVTIEVRQPVVARLRGQPASQAKGNVVCARLAASGAAIDIILTAIGPAAPPVKPVITLGGPVVVMGKPHTNPARVPVSLSSAGPFFGTGKLTRSSPAVGLFTAASAGREITFDGRDNVFQGQQLAAGIHLFAQGASASATPQDVVLTLTLTGGASPVGSPAVARMTAVDLTLDICGSRTAPGVDPPPLSPAEKVVPGRRLQVSDATSAGPRAMLIVRPPKPAIPGTLELHPLDSHARAFAGEAAVAGEAALPDPHRLAIAAMPPGGVRLFAAGVAPGALAPTAGFRLGLAGVEPDGDRVGVSTFALALARDAPPFEKAIDLVQIEGVLNGARGRYGLSDLYGTQRDSLWRIRLDAPGVADASVAVKLISRRSDGTVIEERELTLKRTTGDRLVTPLPILAIPEAQARSTIVARAPQELEVIRCAAGGRLRVELGTPFAAGIGASEGRVRGRVGKLAVAALSTAGVNDQEVQDALARARLTWAQAGIELRLTGPIAHPADPGGLDVIEALPTNFSDDLGGERRQLFRLTPNAGAIDVYYVADIVAHNGEGFGMNDLNPPMAAFSGNIVVRHGVVAVATLAHELGHVLIDLPRSVNAGGDDHRLFSLKADGTFIDGADAPPANVMHRVAMTGREDLTSDQCQRANANRLVGFVE